MKTIPLNRLTLCVLFAVLPMTESQAAAGKFNFVIGDVRVVSAAGERKAERGSEVEAKDTIVSGKDGIAQLRMSDGAFIAVRADTELRIDQYQYSGKADASSTSVLSLVKGTFRAFTGAIASFNKEKFLMKTPGATIGIRGSGNVLNFSPVNNITLNHTIEGSHIITAVDPSGAMRTLVTMPGQTVQVNAVGAMQFVPTPAFILNAVAGAPEPKAPQPGEPPQQQGAGSQGPDKVRGDRPGADKPAAGSKEQGTPEIRQQGGAAFPHAAKPDAAAGRDSVMGAGQAAANGIAPAGAVGPADMPPGTLAPPLPGMIPPPPVVQPSPGAITPPPLPRVANPPLPGAVVPPPMPRMIPPPPVIAPPKVFVPPPPINIPPPIMNPTLVK